jgi:hypothetical protein
VYKALDLKETVPFHILVPAPGLLGGKEQLTPEKQNILIAVSNHL